MDGLCNSPCQTCPDKYVCYCLQITEEQLVQNVTRFALTTLQEVRQHTGAGTGCNACHRRLCEYIDRHAYSSSSSEPICSVR